MSSGLILFQRAEDLYHKGDIAGTLKHYQLSISKILKDENCTALLPAIAPPDFPKELLGGVWKNFVGFFQDGQMNFDANTAPEAFELLNSFKPGSSSKLCSRLERTPRGKILLKGMHITAGITLGLMAWDKGDRATAVKRYEEAIKLAETHPGFQSTAVGWEKYVYENVEEAKFNKALLLKNDTANVHLLRTDLQRRNVAALPNVKITKTGDVVQEDSIMFASDCCYNCKRREPKLSKCSVCKKAQYCNAACQKAHWKVHKLTCFAEKNEV